MKKLFLLLLLLIPCPSFAAISFHGATDLGNNGGSGALSGSYTVGSGTNRFLFCGVLGDVTGGTDDVNAPTFNSVSMTLVDSITTQVASRISYTYILVNPASGAHTLSITCGGGGCGHYLLSGCADYDAANQTGQPDAFGKNTAGGTNSVTKALTTVADNSWTIGFGVNSDSSTVLTGGTGLTTRVADAAFKAWVIMDSAAAITPAGSYTMTMNASTSPTSLGLLVMSFSPNSGGGGGASKTLSTLGAGE